MKLRKVLAGAMALVMAVGAIVVAPVNADAAEQKVADIKSGLKAYYTFDDTLANAQSEEGAAKIHGGAGDTWGAPTITDAVYAEGKNGKAYSFAGNGTVSGDGLELDVQATENFTVGMWVKTAAKVNFQSLLFIPFLNNDFVSFINVGTNFNDFASGAVALYGDWPHVNEAGQAIWLDKNDAESVSDVKDIAVDTWTYVTLTGTADGNLALYYDGKLLADGTIANYAEGAYGAYAGSYMFLGINFWDPSYKGLMDDVVVYDRALSADDVATLYAANGVPTAAVTTTAITLSETAKNMVTGTDFTLEVTALEPVVVTEAATVTWSSSDDTIATVENGKVTAVKAGTATITASVSDTVKATCEVKVTDEVKPLTAIDVTADKTEIELNAKANLTVTYNPEDTTDSKTVTWSTSDDKVATVKDGVVTAVGYGKATITAKVGELTDTVEITVLERPATALDVKADKTELKVGETATITTTVTPADTTDAITYESSNGKVVTVDNGKVTAVGAGTATVTVKAGDIAKEVKFTVTETSEIKLGDLTVDGFWSAHTAGVEIVAGKTYTITLDAKSTDATNAWNCPVYVVYTNSAAKVDNASADYKEYLVCRADNWAWTGAGDSGAGTLGDGYKFETIAVPDSTDWVATYKETMNKGTEGKITAVLSGKNLIVTYNCAGVESKATIPVDTSKPLYISLTGEKVEMTDITAVVKTIPAKGDFSPVLPIALVVLGGAVVVVASKKRFA